MGYRVGREIHLIDTLSAGKIIASWRIPVTLPVNEIVKQLNEL